MSQKSQKILSLSHKRFCHPMSYSHLANYLHFRDLGLKPFSLVYILGNLLALNLNWFGPFLPTLLKNAYRSVLIIVEDWQCRNIKLFSFHYVRMRAMKGKKNETSLKKNMLYSIIKQIEKCNEILTMFFFTNCIWKNEIV